MTYDELWETTKYDNNAHHRFILVEIAEDRVEALEVVEEREKAFKVTLASRPRLYTGASEFWMPKAAFATAKDNEQLRGIVHLTPWYQSVMDRQAKQNLNLVF